MSEFNVWDLVPVVLSAALGVLAWLYTRVVKATDDLEGDLSALKVHVAENYASKAVVRETEDRLTAHLVRMEALLVQSVTTRDR